MIEASELIEHWSVFFFASQPDTTIAVFRILYGCILVFNAFLLFVDARMWYAPDGIYARSFFDKYLGKDRFSIFSFLPPDPSSVYIILYANLFASLFLMIGFLTQISAFVVFITLTSLSNRNPLINHAGDFVLRIMALLFIFSSAGAMLSVDQYLARGTPADGEVVTYSSSWCLRLMQLQICIIYLKAVLSKARREEWINGTAVYYTTQLETFRRFPGGRVFRYGAVQKIGTWGTLMIQFSLCSLIWIEELRYPVLIAGLLFHVSIEYLMNIQLFSWIMIACLLLFIPPEDMQWALEYLGIV